ncbi:MAG: phosphotransferase [Pseudonocardiaceae bacterium]
MRLPRTERGPSLLRKEHKWLPVLAPRLPLPVPVPVRMGEASGRFPMPWTITTWVPGEPCDRTPITRGHHSAYILAGFLQALHQAAPHGAPVNPRRGVALDTLADDFDATLRSIASDHDTVDLRKLWEEAVNAPEWQGPPSWLHGDLHPANVIVREGTVAGVIDFGELNAGDPATDLAAAWLLLPADACARFFDAYGDADEATIRRARGWAVQLGFSLISIGEAWERGLPGGQPTWDLAGRNTLDRVLATYHQERLAPAAALLPEGCEVGAAVE